MTRQGVQAKGRTPHLAAFILQVQGIQQVHYPHRDQCVADYERHSCSDAS